MLRKYSALELFKRFRNRQNRNLKMEHPDPESIRKVVAKEFTKYGIATNLKKLPKKKSTTIVKNRVFQVPLENLPSVAVSVNNQTVIVPKIVITLCDAILKDVTIEGIFRKQGSKIRQMAIIKSLSSGTSSIQDDWFTIDLAVVLKTFLRRLPHPLIPYNLQRVFFDSVAIENEENARNAILLACLLLPIENMNLLMYLMKFFKNVANNVHENKMNAYNLSVVVSPNIFITKTIEEDHTTMICEIVKIMIENSHEIGVIPKEIVKEAKEESYIKTHCKICTCDNLCSFL